MVGTDQVGVFKPHPDVYRRGIEAAGAPADQICMVAAHWWDLLGAAGAGMRSAWIAHKEGVLTEAAGDLDVRGGTLEEAATAIAELSEAG